MTIPIPDPVLIPTYTSHQRSVALGAAFSLQTLLEEHNVKLREDRQRAEDAEAEVPFLYGQDRYEGDLHYGHPGDYDNLDWIEALTSGAFLRDL